MIAEQALNRALLARQGLLEPLDGPPAEVVEAIGAMQGQAWAALPVGLWTRTRRLAPQDLYDALAREELRWGIGIRGTLHLVSDREHPEYAAVAHERTRVWSRKLADTTPGMDAMRAALLEFATAESRTNAEVADFAEAWVAEHPDALDPEELATQRSLKWRPIYRWSGLVRVPAGGRWGAKAPAEHRAAPVPPGSDGAPSFADALAAVARRHLRAFGPATAEDVAGWAGARTPRVRELLEGMDDLVRDEDEEGRVLHDVPDAPRPDADVDAPPRLLGAFDSTLLAYAPGRRGRIVPDALRDVVYSGANLQIRPSFLVDGRVAGIWSAEVRRREATLTLEPAARLPKAARTALTREGEALLRALHPGAKAHRVQIA